LLRSELQLQRLTPADEPTVVAFKQGNVSYSRKKLLPVIKDILKEEHA
jgi:hypothetical protein